MYIYAYIFIYCYILEYIPLCIYTSIYVEKQNKKKEGKKENITLATPILIQHIALQASPCLIFVSLHFCNYNPLDNSC